MLMRLAGIGALFFCLCSNVLLWLYVTLKSKENLLYAVLYTGLSVLGTYKVVQQGSPCALRAQPEAAAKPEYLRFKASHDLVGQECIICLQPYILHQRCRLLPCGHVHHEACIQAWNKPCPLRCEEQTAV